MLFGAPEAKDCLNSVQMFVERVGSGVLKNFRHGCLYVGVKSLVFLAPCIGLVAWRLGVRSLEL